MKKLKIFLTLLSVFIIVLPIAFEVLLYRDNILGLFVPPEIASLIKGGSGNGAVSNQVNSKGDVGSLMNSGFEPPKLVGEPQYNPGTKTFSFTFNVTNPLQTHVAVNKLEAGIVSHDDGVFLGNVSLQEPLTLEPGQTMNITALDVLSNEAINYFKTNSNGKNSTNVDLVNLNVDVAGIRVQVDRQNIGNIPVPPELFR
jgi:hypothetical protein